MYDLNSPGQDYGKLHEQIKGYGNWWHHLDSTWLIITDKDAAEIRDHLKLSLDKNDELLVVKFGSEWAGSGFSKEAYQWLRDNLYK